VERRNNNNNNIIIIIIDSHISIAACVWS